MISSRRSCESRRIASSNRRAGHNGRAIDSCGRRISHSERRIGNSKRRAAKRHQKEERDEGAVTTATPIAEGHRFVSHLLSRFVSHLFSHDRISNRKVRHSFATLIPRRTNSPHCRAKELWKVTNSGRKNNLGKRRMRKGKAGRESEKREEEWKSGRRYGKAGRGTE